MTEARAYRGTRQLVLVLNTRELVHAEGDWMLLTDRNTRAARPFAPRGRDTLVSLRPEIRRRIVEVVVRDGVPDLERFVVSASEEGGADPPSILFRR